MEYTKPMPVEDRTSMRESIPAQVPSCEAGSRRLKSLVIHLRIAGKGNNRMKMPKEEFIVGYCERSGVTWEELSQWAMVLPCDCEEDGCRGWVMVEK